jgi:alpha-tubulin suppressor-like RCC1 family protein
MSHV